jgi:hypothetical protein
MPQGKGTYGKKRGRPPTKKKTAQKPMKGKVKGKQGKIAKAAPPFNKITGADFKALKGKKGGKQKGK